jgi:hypothetical protein
VTTTAISAVVPRRRTTLVGRVVSVFAFTRPWVRVDVVLSDGTGDITLRFLGRRAIHGMTRDRLVRAEGTASGKGEELVMLNPLYEFLLAPHMRCQWPDGEGA